jgi:CheY-like chemotaxis protein
MSGMRILVIEDNLLNMVLVRDLLTLAGFQVLEAKDAETGLKMAREQRPDAILMDIQLPGMDGIEATRIIRGDNDLKSIPVAALTSYAMERDMQEAKEAGCVRFISKPINTREFAKTVEDMIAEQQKQNDPCF